MHIPRQGKPLWSAQFILNINQIPSNYLLHLGILPLLITHAKLVLTSSPKIQVEETVKLDDSGNPVKRTRMKVTVGYFDIIGPKFWNEHPYILNELKWARQFKFQLYHLQLHHVNSLYLSVVTVRCLGTSTSQTSYCSHQLNACDDWWKTTAELKWTFWS